MDVKSLTLPLGRSFAFASANLDLTKCNYCGRLQILFKKEFYEV